MKINSIVKRLLLSLCILGLVASILAVWDIQQNLESDYRLEWTVIFITGLLGLTCWIAFKRKRVFQ